MNSAVTVHKFKLAKGYGVRKIKCPLGSVPISAGFQGEIW